MSDNSQDSLLLPHHEQRALCTTRLPYRQGRKLTAVKVYTINNESRHLLVFGVPSLNLRQETKALFLKFGKLQFNITKYPSEQFTETYHAVYENIQSARIAKKMLDTKNFYGGHLHVCYAPELENIEETKEKMLLRQKNVVARLKNLQKASVTNNETPNNLKINMEGEDLNKNSLENKLYMGEINNIQYGKRKNTEIKSANQCKRKKPRNIDGETGIAKTESNDHFINKPLIESDYTETMTHSVSNVASSNIEVVDFTSPNIEVLTNINESLNYNNFGKELIRRVPYKPLNKIKFNLNKNT